MSAAPPSNETLRVAANLGALRDASQTDVEVSLKVWAEELMRILEVPAEMLFYRAMPEIRRDFDAGRVNFVIADGLDLLRHFGPNDLADGFGGRSSNEDKLFLLVRKGAGIRQSRDLAGKRVALLSNNAVSDLWLDTCCLRVFQKSCAKAGVVVSKENRSQQLVLKLFFDKADAALVRGYAYDLALELNPQIRARTDILEQISLYPGALGLFGRQVSPAFREYIIAKVPQLHDQARGRQLLEVMQTERVGRVPHSLLDPIRELVRENETLSRRYVAEGGRK
ncbi:MAG: PhnD/SsuA/transferrin family substrate-binding protein [Hydrogenophilales bacterium]|nr:PhnD/SsuA/transferrin family substrate-binding protein [Hydrogenophilales bacterium]